MKMTITKDRRIFELKSKLSKAQDALDMHRVPYHIRDKRSSIETTLKIKVFKSWHREFKTNTISNRSMFRISQQESIIKLCIRKTNYDDFRVILTADTHKLIVVWRAIYWRLMESLLWKFNKNYNYAVFF